MNIAMMKQLLLAFTLINILAACGSDPKSPDAQSTQPAVQEQKLEAKLLKNYFLLNSVEVKERQCWLMSGQAEFEKMFGLAKTMRNEIITPNFDSSFVGAIAVPPARRMTDFRITKIERVGDVANVHFEIIEGDDELTWTSQPVQVFTFPKDPGIKTVNFIQTGVQISSFPAPTAGSVAAEQGIPFEEMPNYFIKKTASAGKTPNCLVLADEDSFKANLFLLKDAKANALHFSKDLYLVVVLPETQKATEVKFVSMNLEGDNLKATVAVRQGSDLSYSMQPNVVASVPKEGVKTVTFYNGSQKLATVPVTVSE